MSTTKMTAKERRRNRIRVDIVDAALEIITADGVEGASIERISAAAGIARATVYAHFPNGREEILRGAYAQTGRVLLKRAAAAADTVSAWDQRIVSYARTMIEFSSSPTLGRFYSVSGPHLVGFRPVRGEGSQGYFDVICAELAAAREAGELAVDTDPEALAVLLVSSLRDAGIAAAHEPDSAVRYIRAVQSILDGLKAIAQTLRPQYALMEEA